MNRQQQILNIEQLAVFLMVPKSTVYKLVREGRVPGHKVGRHWRFSREAILLWMEQLSPHVDESGNTTRLKGKCHEDH